MENFGKKIEFNKSQDSSKLKDFANLELDFHDQHKVDQILASGSPERIKRLKDFYKWTEEELETYVKFAKLRKEILQKINKEVAERIKENPIPDKEELKLGTYKEFLEPQVRKAVLRLREKGYSTIESGFYGLNRQKITFKQEEVLSNFKISDELKKLLESKNIQVKIKKDEIEFTSPFLKEDELAEVWEKLIEEMPDLGKEAGESENEGAKTFRQKIELFLQGKIRKEIIYPAIFKIRPTPQELEYLKEEN